MSWRKNLREDWGQRKESWDAHGWCFVCFQLMWYSQEYADPGIMDCPQCWRVPQHISEISMVHTYLLYLLCLWVSKVSPWFHLWGASIPQRHFAKFSGVGKLAVYKPGWWASLESFEAYRRNNCVFTWFWLIAMRLFYFIINQAGLAVEWSLCALLFTLLNTVFSVSRLYSLTCQAWYKNVIEQISKLRGRFLKPTAHVCFSHTGQWLLLFKPKRR